MLEKPVRKTGNSNSRDLYFNIVQACRVSTHVLLMGAFEELTLPGYLVMKK